MSILTHESPPLSLVLDELRAGPDVIAPNARRIPVLELRCLLEMQRVPRRHWAYVCPVCRTVQSAESLVRAGAGESEFHVEQYLGRSCVQRWVAARREDRAIDPDVDPCFGCDWTAGGFLSLCRLIVVDEAGVEHPMFEPATTEQAQALRQQHLPPLVVPEELVAAEALTVGGRWVQL